MRCVVIVLFVMSALITACSPIAMPKISTYQLQPLPSSSRLGAQTYYTLLVSNPTTSDTYSNTNMYYSTDNYAISSFAKNQWAAPPGQMLAPSIVTALRNQHFFKAVVMPPFSGSADFQLTTQLQQFQQNFAGNVSEFKLTLLASLINNKTKRIISQRRFDAAVIAPENTPYGGVVAANRASAQLLNQLAKWCVNAIRS